MLLYQGVEAFRIWTGRDPPLDVMEDALSRALNTNQGPRIIDYIDG